MTSSSNEKSCLRCWYLKRKSLLNKDHAVCTKYIKTKLMTHLQINVVMLYCIQGTRVLLKVVSSYKQVHVPCKHSEICQVLNKKICFTFYVQKRITHYELYHVSHTLKYYIYTFTSANIKLTIQLTLIKQRPPS